MNPRVQVKMVINAPRKLVFLKLINSFLSNIRHKNFHPAAAAAPPPRSCSGEPLGF